MSAIRRLLTRNLNRNIKKISIGYTRPQSSSATTHIENNNILQSDLTHLYVPQVSIVEFVFNKTEKWPNRIATECAITGRKYTYAELESKVTNLSKAFRKKLELRKGDVLSVLLPNCPEFSIAALGALKAGLIVSTMNPIYTPDEISRQINDSSTKAIITLNELYPLAKKSVELSGKSIPILSIKVQPDQSLAEGAINFSEFLEDIDYPETDLSKPDDIAFLPYSSGTTGLPKGVQLTHRNIVSNICQFDSPGISVLRETTPDHQDITPAILPKFHIYGLVVTCLHPLEKGVRIVTLPKFTPDLYINTLNKYKPHVLFLAPPIILFLSGHPEVKKENLASIRSVISGAAPLGALDEERFLNKANKPIEILQGYGLTETSPVVAMTGNAHKKFPNSAGTIGRPVPLTQVKIVDMNDPSNTPLGPNQTGELLVKGPQVMRGYHNRPKETKNTITEDGWLRTGDMSYYNENNLLFITDRLKELIKVKGFQVPPAELEEIIRDYPDVEDVGVIGIPHINHGEVPRAYIVAKNGKKIDISKLNDFVASKVAPYKQLKGGIELIDAIPKNASGKILRRELKLKYQREK